MEHLVWDKHRANRDIFTVPANSNGQCMYNVTLRHVFVTIAAVEKQ
jgi:hypothetical protein